MATSWRRLIRSVASRLRPALGAGAGIYRAPIAETGLDEWAEHVRAAQAAGLVIHRPPHTDDQLRQWASEAMAILDDHTALHPDPEADSEEEETQTRLLFLAAALRTPTCLVATQGLRLLAAVDFQVRAGHVEVGVMGSRRLLRGAGQALEFALAEEAARRGLAVKGEYVPQARGFHERIGRRLDLPPGQYSSEWTAKDCQFIVKGLRARI